jgi:succinoglycan biosynthesis protein ExoO
MTAFSVVVPLYNKGPHIRRAIQSVLNQVVQDFEIIVVDDGSTDRSRSEVSSIIDPRVKLLMRNGPGPGGYAARNHGIQASRAPWIAFLDADDEWTPTYLETISALQKAYPELRCFCTGYLNAYADGRMTIAPFSQHYSSAGNRRINLREYVRETADGRCPLWTSVVVVDRLLIKKAGMFPEGRCIRGGDADTWLRLLQLTDAAWSARVEAVYHRDAENMVTHNTKRQLYHCVDFTLQRMIEQKDLKDGLHTVWPTRIDLKRLWNHYKKGPIKQRMRKGTLRLSDVRNLSFIGGPGYWFFVFLCSLIPGVFFRLAVGLRQKMGSRKDLPYRKGERP